MAFEEKRAAERRFEDLRKFANFVLNGLDDELRKSPTQARALLAKEGVEYLDGLAAEKGGDPSIKRDLVNGYMKNGDVKGNLYGASLGETAGAEESYRKAVRFAEELVKGNPSNLEDRRLLVTAQVSLAEILNTSGNRTEAKKYYEMARQIQEATMAMGTPDAATLQVGGEFVVEHGFVSHFILRSDGRSGMLSQRPGDGESAPSFLSEQRQHPRIHAGAHCQQYSTGWRRRNRRGGDDPSHHRNLPTPRGCESEGERPQESLRRRMRFWLTFNSTRARVWKLSPASAEA